MEKEKYEEKIANLSREEQKERLIYLKKIANGEICGPRTNYASIDLPWLKYFDETDIRLDIPKMKVYDYLLINNNDNLNKNAINYFGKKITYISMFKEIKKVAKALKSLGIGKGDVVTLSMASTPEMVYLLYAINRVGAVCDVIDPRLSKEEIKDEINLVNPKLHITLDACYDVVKDASRNTSVKNIVVVSPVQSLPLPIKVLANIKNKSDYNGCIKWNDFIKEGSKYNGEIDSHYEENQGVALVHTGGTTGSPKGVLLTNENFISMTHMHKHSNINFERGDKFLNVLPPFIAYCLCNAYNNPLTLGMEVTLVPKWDVPDFPKLVDKYKPNHVLAGPILWEYVMKSNIKDLSYLKTPVSGGDALSSELEQRINEDLYSRGCKFKVAQGYGMTEVSSAATFSYARANKLGSVGIPFIKNVVSIFDPDTLEEKQIGEEGEIWISSPTIMKEYYNNKKATEELIYTDKYGRKWVRTGDIGKIDNDGSVFIVGRMKRMIVRNGNKIFPSNVENILLTNENIENCALVGIPDEVERTVPVLHLIIKDGVSQEEIIKWIEETIKQTLPEFNIPKKYFFRNEMPLTSINKIDFRALEAESIESKKLTLSK